MIKLKISEWESSTMKEQILSIYIDILMVCEEQGLLGGTMFAVDGCKLPGNASKRWSGRIDDFMRKKDRIEQKIKQLLQEQEAADKQTAGNDEAEIEIAAKDQSRSPNSRNMLVTKILST